MTPGFLFARYAHELFEARHAPGGPARAVLAQGAHAVRKRVLAQLALRRAVVDEPAQALVDGQHLVDAGAAAIARLVAGRAARGRVDRSIRLAAFRAEPAHEALRHDADQA